MAPTRHRVSIPKEKFSAYFGALRTIAYHDPSSRGTGAHGIRSMSWNPTGTLIATGAERILRVWNPERQNVKNSTELKGHAATIEKVGFSPVKDAELCSVSGDGVAKFWDVKTKALINEVKGLGDAFTLAWAPDGKTLIVGNKSDNLFVLSPTSPTPISSHQQTVQTNQLVFCHSGRKIFLTTGEGKVKILSYPGFEPILYTSHDPSIPFALNGHTSSCVSIDLQPTARFLATGGHDSIIALWDTTDWICQRTLIDMTGPVRSISFSFDGTFIIGGSEEGSGLGIAHTETGEAIHTIKTAGPCPIVAWHPSSYVLAYSDLGSLRIIGVSTDKK
ncbi:unnamed protein product [Diplocarpon coronariae]